MKIKNITTLLFLIFLTLGNATITLGQCTSCQVTIEGNNNPSRAIQNNDLVCISGNRTISIPVQNLTNIRICIASEASFSTNLLNNISSLASIENYGTLNVNSNPNGSWSIQNYADMSLETTLNSGKSIENYSNLTIRNNSDINGSFLSYGHLDVIGNVRFQNNQTSIIAGTATISGGLTVNSPLLLAGSIQSNTLHLSGQGSIGALDGNQCNSVTVAGQFYSDSNGGLTGNNYDFDNSGSALFVNKMPTGNANPKLAGGATIGACPESTTCFNTQVITTSSGVDVLYIYKCSNTFVLPELLEGEELIDAQIFVVGAGGGGGYGNAAGGAGAGGVEYQSNLDLLPLIPYPIEVGIGGLGSRTDNRTGTNGGESSFAGILTAQGGGGGGSVNADQGKGRNGGSGGGGAYTSSGTMGNSGQSQSNFGRSGGNGNGSGNGNQRSGGGGGGAGNSGNPGNGNSGGNGGDGIVIDGSQGGISILGGIAYDFLTSNSISTIYGAGGGGNGSNPGQGNGGGLPSGGTGGSSIGGNGNRNGIGGDGLNNTGSGGGAGTSGGGRGGNGIVIIRVTYRILPVEFLAFQASYQSETRSANLSWDTAREWQNSSFEIERSLFSVHDWETVGTIPGKGYSDETQSYEFKDVSLPLQGGFIYYRIKQTDENGTISYSNTRSISVPQHPSSTYWNISPNPGQGSNIQVKAMGNFASFEGLVSVRISTPSGTNTFTMEARPEDLTSAFQHYFGTAKPGFYLVSFSWENKLESHKIIRY